MFGLRRGKRTLNMIADGGEVVGCVGFNQRTATATEWACADCGRRALFVLFVCVSAQVVKWCAKDVG